MPIIVADDVEAAADFYRPMLALYIGGMGAREVNFHNNVFARMGYEGEAKLIQDLYLDGKKDEAAAAVPTQLVEDVALIGPKEKIRDDLEMWRESDVTTMIVSGAPAAARNDRGARARMRASDARISLTAEEARVLGCLMEKAVTTPDNYPLSVNALLIACNQSTNRDPIVEYDEIDRRARARVAAREGL